MEEEKKPTLEDLPPPYSHPGARYNKLLLHWRSPEFITHQKGVTWFLIAGVITLLLIIYAIYTDSATMAIVFIVFGGVYYMMHNQEPKIIDIKLTELGVFVDKNFYPYNMINSFWIIYNPPYVRTLNLRLSDKTSTKVVIQLDVQNPVDVRKMLAKEIPEVEGASESISEILIRLLRL